MKYVVWGTGIYGKRAVKILGIENIVSFVISDAKQWGGDFQGKTIISIDEYKRSYADCLLIVAFEKYESAVEILEMKGIKEYLLWLAEPAEFLSDNQDMKLNGIKQYVLHAVKEYDVIGIKGENAYSIWIYDYLKSKGKKNVFLLDPVPCLENIYKKHNYLLKKSIDLGSFRNKVILNCARIKEESGLSDNSNTKVINIHDCSYVLEKFHNPKIEKFKNLYSGKRCFIIATGPSLRISDLDKLYQNHELCISMNSIWKSFAHTDWRPDFYLVTDAGYAETEEENIEKLDIENILIGNRSERYWSRPHKQNILKFNLCKDIPFEGRFSFSKDFSKVCYAGFTVTYACIQFAAYMGIKEIYLLGVDFNYIPGSRENHFAGDSEIDQIDHKEAYMQTAYETAKKYAEANGIRIYNASRGGKLEVFERVAFDRLYGQ